MRLVADAPRKSVQSSMRVNTLATVLGCPVRPEFRLSTGQTSRSTISPLAKSVSEKLTSGLGGR